MDWKSLLNNRRLDLESYETRSTGAHVAEIHSSQGDVDRVLYSSAFRRLKGKTQVFMFPPTYYHRDRLTHSLEVYNISRNLVSTIIRRVEASPEGAAYGLVDAMRLKGVDMLDVVDSISAAALAHDIGNTPFGHIGEHAIRSWFREYSDMLPSFNEELDEHERTDFFHFDGNAQAFRVVSRLQGWSEGGLRLSYMTLGALIKYPQPSPATNKNKFGYFKSDLEPFLKVCHELDLKSVTPTTFSRHPFAFIVETTSKLSAKIRTR